MITYGTVRPGDLSVLDDTIILVVSNIMVHGLSANNLHDVTFISLNKHSFYIHTQRRLAGNDWINVYEGEFLLSRIK